MHYTKLVVIATYILYITGVRHQGHEFDEVITRKHLQDCRNACRKTHDFTNHRHANDAVSVDRIVQELQLESASPIIVYT